MGEGRFVPVVRSVAEPEAYPLVGRLRSDGIDARLAPSGDNLYPYRPKGAPSARCMVIVPEEEADRARWIVRGIAPDLLADRPEGPTDYPGNTGP